MHSPISGPPQSPHQIVGTLSLNGFRPHRLECSQFLRTSCIDETVSVALPLYGFNHAQMRRHLLAGEATPHDDLKIIAPAIAYHKILDKGATFADLQIDIFDTGVLIYTLEAPLKKNGLMLGSLIFQYAEIGPRGPLSTFEATIVSEFDSTFRAIPEVAARLGKERLKDRQIWGVFKKYDDQGQDTLQRLALIQHDDSYELYDISSSDATLISPFFLDNSKAQTQWRLPTDESLVIDPQTNQIRFFPQNHRTILVPLLLN